MIVRTGAENAREKISSDFWMSWAVFNLKNPLAFVT